MEEKSILKKYEAFLKLNKLEISKESAKDFTELYEESSILGLSMEYVNKGGSMSSNPSKKKYFENALKVDPRNFAATICLLELKSFCPDEYEEALKMEYDRLLKDDYMNPRYYEKQVIDFERYQETFNYLRGLRSYYILLIGNDYVEKAIQIGQYILELNPKDHFHIESSLPFLYLRMNDELSAISLIHENEQLIPGTKEIILSYAAYLNMDTHKALEYLDDVNVVNPYFYRILVGDEEMTYSFAKEDMYSKAEYLFLNFSLVGAEESKEYEDILNESIKRNPLEKSVSKDEWITLEVMALMPSPCADMYLLKEEASKHINPDAKEFQSFNDGRIGAALEALSIQKITENNLFTPYGEIFYRKIKERNKLLIKLYREEAKAYFDKDEFELGRNTLLKAIDLDKQDYELKADFIANAREYKESDLLSLIEEMNNTYMEYMGFTKYSTIEARQALVKNIDALTFKYFEESLKHGIYSMCLNYTRISSIYHKYSNLFQMARCEDRIEGKKKEDPFFLLYKGYKENQSISHDLVVDCVRESKMDYIEACMNSKHMPYHLISPEFEEAYKRELLTLGKEEIFTKNELEILEIILEGGKSLKDAMVTYEFHTVASKLEKDCILVPDKTGLSYVLSEYILALFKEEK